MEAEQSLPRLFPSHITENMLRCSFRPASEISRIDSEEFFFVVQYLTPPISILWRD